MGEGVGSEYSWEELAGLSPPTMRMRGRRRRVILGLAIVALALSACVRALEQGKGGGDKDKKGEGNGGEGKAEDDDQQDPGDFESGTVPEESGPFSIKDPNFEYGCHSSLLCAFCKKSISSRLELHASAIAAPGGFMWGNHAR